MDDDNGDDDDTAVDDDVAVVDRNIWGFERKGVEEESDRTRGEVERDEMAALRCGETGNDDDGKEDDIEEPDVDDSGDDVDDEDDMEGEGGRIGG